MKTAKTALAAIIATITTIGTAQALPIASGSFTLTPNGGVPITVDTGNITLSTSSRTVASWAVDVVTPNLDLALSHGDAAAFSSTTQPVPTGTGTIVPVTFGLHAGSLGFSFDQGETLTRVALNTKTNTSGAFSDQFTGLLVNGGGVFQTGTPVTLAETCTQPVVRGKPGAINCGDAVVTFGNVPEPSTLILLSGALLGTWAILRRRPEDGDADGTRV